jgi:hypothetical protein
MVEIQQQSHILASSWVGVCRDGGLEEGFRMWSGYGYVTGFFHPIETLLNFLKMVGYTSTTPGLGPVLCLIHLEQEVL